MEKDIYKLDNPVWHSLSESHQRFAIDYGSIKFYHPDYCPFAGLQTTEGVSEHLDQYSTLANTFFVVGLKPEVGNNLTLKKELVCLQMIIHQKIDVPANEIITKLTQEHVDALYQLVNLVQPGYFKKKTSLLGNYYGIFKEGELVSVTGERMAMNDFVEVSAIVTHPTHTGKGFAKQLIAHTVTNILNRNQIPYLHVVESNYAAIKLYETLGFTVRRKMSFWNISK